MRGIFWPLLGFRNPTPVQAKRRVLLQYGGSGCIWVETGTYLGRTTKWLAEISSSVISIESQPYLAKYVAHRLRRRSNVKVIEGLSEETLANVLPEISGKVSFWLDGHFSAGITGSGAAATPIRHELACIEEHLNRFQEVTVLIDDFRCFGFGESDTRGYPPRTELVGWAIRNKLLWTVEHDIFVATNVEISEA